MKVFDPHVLALQFYGAVCILLQKYDMHPDLKEEGLKEYSMEYFIQEIRDEMTGYIPSEDSELILSCISSLHNREFRFEEIEKTAEMLSDESNARKKYV